MTSAQAAATLGVSRREVQRLTQSGALSVVGTVGQALLLDPVSVHRHAGQQVAVGRPWSARTAWAAVDLLGGGRADLLDASRRRHLRAKLARLGVDEFVWLARRRADEHRYDAWRGQLSAIRAAVVPTGTSDDPQRLAGLFGLSTDPERVAGYVTLDELPELVRRFELSASATGPVTLLAAGTDVTLPAASAVLTALDLATSIDPRERTAGRRVLGEHLQRFRP